MIIQFLAIIAGVAAHQFRPMVEKLDTDSQTVKNLANYSIGVIAIGAVYECALRVFGLSDEARHRASAAFWLSAVFTGIGVFLGYVLDSKRNKN